MIKGYLQPGFGARGVRVSVESMRVPIKSSVMVCVGRDQPSISSYQMLHKPYWYYLHCLLLCTTYRLKMLWT